MKARRPLRSLACGMVAGCLAASSAPNATDGVGTDAAIPSVRRCGSSLRLQVAAPALQAAQGKPQGVARRRGLGPDERGDLWRDVYREVAIIHPAS